MGKKGKIYIALVVFAILSIVVIEMTKPKKVNWFPSYALHHKLPFGSLVFKEQLKRYVDTVITIEQPPFEFLNKNKVNGTYLFYNGGIQFGDDELEELLKWTAKGNTLVVSAVNFEEKLLDTLQLDTRAIDIFNNFNNEFIVQLTNPAFKKQRYKFDRANTLFHFTKIDTLNTKAIGLIDKPRDEDETPKPLINAIKQPFGNGNIILSAFPQAFTNYFILNSPNQDYTSGLLSYIDTERPIYMDTYYKNGKKTYTSPMYLFLSTKSLKWAYYTVLIAVLIYILFEGKRKQRAIPIIKPLKNQTVVFTRTIANMYYEGSKHKAVSEHLIQHFMEHIRSHLYLGTSEINDTFIKNLSARSNNTIEDTQQLFSYIAKLQKQNKLDKSELERLNTLIETFKSNSKWKTKP